MPTYFIDLIGENWMADRIGLDAIFQYKNWKISAPINHQS